MEQEQISQYQIVIGSAQWAVTLGQYDVQYATNTLAIFSQYPREVHMNISFRMFGYWKHHIWDKIRFYPQQINTERIYFIYDHE